MRVLLVCHRFPPDGVAGVERYTQTLAAGLSASGDRVTVATRRTDASPVIKTVCEQLTDGTVVHRYVGGSLALSSFLEDYERIEDCFIQTLEQSSPDVVHINHLIGLSPRLIEVTHRFSVPVVLSLHDFYTACPLAHLQKAQGGLCAGPDGGRECAATCFAGERDAELRWGLRAAYFRRLLAAADHVTTPSQFLGDYLARFGADERPIHVMPLGVGVAPGSGAGHSASVDGGLVLAFIGVVVAHKGVHLIIEALAAARLGRIELRIIGQTIDERYADRLRRSAAEVPGLELRLAGTFEPTELPELLRGVDATLMPSVVPETFGLTAREALALGIPVIASRIGALPEVIVDGCNGLLFAPGDVKELATTLRRYATDGDLRTSLAAEARKTPYLTVGTHVAAIRALYDSVLEFPRVAEPADDVAERSFLFDALVGAGFAERPIPSLLDAGARSRRYLQRMRRRGTRVP
jgi:glycosyltransferase involved in cell wall biosynthesis